MEFIPAKTILSRQKDGNMWFGTDYNMNLYRGCSHGCIYCDSRSNCYQIDDFDTVRGKENAIEILHKELASKRKKGVVGIGAMSDTYNPFEKKYKITRKALKLIERYGFGVSIDTKSDLITRDIDILKRINERNSVILKITITASSDELSKKIEPNVNVSSRRFNAIKSLTDAGLFAGVLMNPILPFITDTEENIKNMVRLSYKSGAKFIHTYMGVTLRENQRQYYYERIDNLFPELTNKYKKIYGYKYICTPPNSEKLYKIFTNECDKYGLIYKMEDIIKEYKKDKSYDGQLSFFENN